MEEHSPDRNRGDGDAEQLDHVDVEKIREELDWDRLAGDFIDWLGQPARTEDRVDRVMKNTVHVLLGLATAGVWVFAVWGYYLFKFREQVNLDDYKVNIYLEEQEEGSQ